MLQIIGCNLFVYTLGISQKVKWQKEHGSLKKRHAISLLAAVAGVVLGRRKRECLALGLGWILGKLLGNFHK